MMYSSRDLVEAYTFVANRMRAALLRGEPDALRTPLRRTPVGLSIGVGLGALVIVIVIVVRLVVPASASADQLAQPGTLIMVEETGARFVLTDGRLHPVLNYASARLLLGTQMKVAEVPRDQLPDLPLGAAVGTPWAPETLPPSTVPAAHVWLACARQTVDGGVRKPSVTLLLDPAMTTSAASMTGAIVARGSKGQEFLVEAGRRMAITAPWVLSVVGGGAVPVVDVRDTWLDALPQGPDLGSPDLGGRRGAPGPTVDGAPTRIGELFVSHSEAGADRHFVVVPGGLMPLGSFAALLALADPATAAAYPGQAVVEQPLSVPALTAAALVPAPDSLALLPDVPRPIPVDASENVPCAQIGVDGAHMDTALVTVPSDRIGAGIPPGAGVQTAAGTADTVSIPTGGGMLARTMPAPPASIGGLFLITADGAKYPVASDDAAKALGYQPGAAVPVPPPVLAMLPTGPALVSSGGGS